MECPDLDDPNNGEISYDSAQSVGSVATYSCSYGYYLVGPSTRTCQQDGTWTGIQTDYKCECKSRQIILQVDYYPPEITRYMVDYLL